MSSLNTHHFKALKAYYTKRGRLWHVETNGDHHRFKSVEAMVEAFPDLLQVEAIKATIERRAIAKSPVTLEPDTSADQDIQSKTSKCYYCTGTGEVIAGIPCSNCRGKGKVTVTTKAF